MMNRRTFFKTTVVTVSTLALPVEAKAIADLARFPYGVPEPPEGQQWYLGVAGGYWADRCVLCLKTLDHPFYTAGNIYPDHTHDCSDPHPPLLFGAISPGGVPGGKGVLWTPDAVSATDGFVYVTGTGSIWTLEHEQAGRVLRAKYQRATYRNRRRQAIQTQWNLRRAIRNAEQSIVRHEAA